jgi:hypothetical protein
MLLSHQSEKALNGSDDASPVAVRMQLRRLLADPLFTANSRAAVRCGATHFMSRLPSNSYGYSDTQRLSHLLVLDCEENLKQTINSA